MSKLLKRYLKGYERFDDIDSIASAMRDKASKIGATLDGVLQIVEHPGRFEIDAVDGIVIAPRQVAQVASRRGGSDDVANELVPKLRALIDSDVEPGVKQRALYVLVRLEGVECREALAGLDSGDGGSEQAVLCALDDPDFAGNRPASRLPAAYAKPITRLCERGKSEGGPDSWLVFDRPLVSLALRLPDPGPALIAIIEDAGLRDRLPEAIEASSDVEISSALAALETRFEDCARVIEEAREGGLPNRNAVARAATIASIVGRHPSLAARAASILDLAPGIYELGPPRRARGPERIHPQLEGFAKLISASIDALDATALESVAKHLLGGYAPFFPTAAAAWVRLDIDRAAPIAARFGEGEPRLRELRWDAAAEAFTAVENPSASLAAIFIEHADSHNLSDALGAALAHAPADVDKIESMIRKARNNEELLPALELAATHGLTSVLRAILLKFRDGPFRVTPAIEALLPALIDEDNEDYVEAEIEDENPFRDRREALRRALLEARG